MIIVMCLVDPDQYNGENIRCKKRSLHDQSFLTGAPQNKSVSASGYSSFTPS